MNYREYYGEPFKEDLNAFRNWATASRVSHKEDVEGVFAIQPHIIKEHSKTIASWGTDHLSLFATALFFTVLVDQVCYTHFHSVYPKFQSLTRYPKLRGNCPGGCMNFHPSAIFSLLTPCLPQYDINFKLECAPLVESVLPIMKQEVFDFLTQHAPTVDKEVFWERCSQHVPFQRYHELQKKKRIEYEKREKEQRKATAHRRSKKMRNSIKRQKRAKEKAKEREKILYELVTKSAENKWNYIASNTSVNIDYYPIEWTNEPKIVFRNLSSTTRIALIERMRFKRRGQWKKLRNLLIQIEKEQS